MRSLAPRGGNQSHTLTTAQMPVHSHGVSDPTHTHSVYDPSHAHQGYTYTRTTIDQTGGAYPQGADASGYVDGSQLFNTLGAYTGISLYGAYTGISIQNNGSGSAHPITQPTLVLNKIIRL